METEASIKPITVVGTRMKFVFLRYAAQANLYRGQRQRELWACEKPVKDLTGERFDMIRSSGGLLPCNIRDEASAHHQDRLLLRISEKGHLKMDGGYRKGGRVPCG